jgi:hypothetical protein
MIIRVLYFFYGYVQIPSCSYAQQHIAIVEFTGWFHHRCTLLDPVLVVFNSPCLLVIWDCLYVVPQRH